MKLPNIKIIFNRSEERIPYEIEVIKFKKGYAINREYYENKFEVVEALVKEFEKAEQ